MLKINVACSIGIDNMDYEIPCASPFLPPSQTFHLNSYQVGTLTCSPSCSCTGVWIHQARQGGRRQLWSWCLPAVGWGSWRRWRLSALSAFWRTPGRRWSLPPGKENRLSHVDGSWWNGGRVHAERCWPSEPCLMFLKTEGSDLYLNTLRRLTPIISDFIISSAVSACFRPVHPHQAVIAPVKKHPTKKNYKSIIWNKSLKGWKTDTHLNLDSLRDYAKNCEQKSEWKLCIHFLRQSSLFCCCLCEGF